MEQIVLKALTESARLMTETQKKSEQVIQAAQMIADSFTRSGRLFIFGNGGSAADAQHLAAEFVNRFLIERPPLPALALTTDTSVLTSIANDYSYKDIFSKQLKALSRQGDVAWGLTTSGNSPNVISGLTTARHLGLKTMVMTGAGGGEAKGLADIHYEVPTSVTPRIQEVHIVLGHVICELVDHILFQLPIEGRQP